MSLLSLIHISEPTRVNYIEDATGSVNDGDVYEMADLDIVDFVGCVLDWSGVVDVFYYEEYREK